MGSERYLLFKTILSLCDYTGTWAKPYADAGYNIVLVDIKYGQDVRLLNIPDCEIHGILAAPPCTHLAGSGARWWEEKGEQALFEALAIVDACLRIVLLARPKWWCLENPVGRLKNYLGPPRMYIQPCDYGDPYTKKTCLWGDFNTELLLNPVEPSEGSKIHRIPPSKERSILRSITPEGFAQAYFKANP